MDLRKEFFEQIQPSMDIADRIGAVLRWSGGFAALTRRKSQHPAPD